MWFIKKIFILSFLFVISISIVNGSAAPYDSYQSIGSRFLSLTSLDTFAYPIYENTTIFIDQNRDGIWDFKKNLFLDEVNELVLENKLYPKIGSLIYSNKPIALYSKFGEFRKNNDFQYFYDVVPDISYISKTYFLYVGNWTILSDKDSVCMFSDNEFKIKKGESVNIVVEKNSKFFCDNIFYAFNEIGLAQRPGNSYISQSEIIKLEIYSDNTKISFDYDNDGYFDEYKVYDVGSFIEEFNVAGVRLFSNKEFGTMSSNKNLNNYINYYPLLNLSYQSNEHYFFDFTLLNHNNEQKNVNLYKSITNYLVSEINSTSGCNSELISNEAKLCKVYANGKVKSNYPYLGNRYNFRAQGGYPKFSWYTHMGHLVTPAVIMIQDFDSKNILLKSNVTLTSKIYNTFFNVNLSDIKLTLFSDGFDSLNYERINFGLYNSSTDKLIQSDYGNLYLGMDNSLVFNVSNLPSGTYFKVDQNFESPKIYGKSLFVSPKLDYDVLTWN